MFIDWKNYYYLFFIVEEFFELIFVFSHLLFLFVENHDIG
jgi:hypothetical protein